MEKLHLLLPIALLAFIVLFFCDWAVCRKGKAPETEPGCKKSIDLRDSLIIIAITGVYALVSLLNLGSLSSPRSFCRFDGWGEYAQAELTEPEAIGSAVFFTGIHTGSYYLQISSDGESWTDVGCVEQSYSELLRWKSIDLWEYAEPTTRYFRIIADAKLWLGEVMLYDPDGLPISSLSYSKGSAPLFDEPETVPGDFTYLTSSYFDEIYHVRTAYEHMEAQEPYEISHPPLGKLIISIGIVLFGLCPFGWRFMGTLAGILMLPLIYILTKRMFGGRAVPAAVSFLMATDFMHFTQTRIATIDSYSVFFILLMYLFMYIYLQSDRQSRGWMLPLGLSGLFFGMGAASKWTCIYAGAGLALLWLIDRVERCFEARDAGTLREYKRETVENILFCLGAFVLVPCIIYYLSYWCYGTARGMSGVSMLFSREYLDIVLGNQKYMLSYHSGVTATHPYSSRWWQWMLDLRPILYYLDYGGDGTKSTIGAMMNPLLCWAGLGAMIIMAKLWIKDRDKTARFIFLGYMAQLLPWVFVSRITFAYHYFPASVFLLLALGHILDGIRRKNPAWKRSFISFCAVSLVLFAAFYPVLSGADVSGEFADKFLGWFESWPF